MTIIQDITHPFPGTFAVVTGVLLLGYALFSHLLLSLSARWKFIEQTPWVGVQKQWFARSRAGLRFIKDSQAIYHDGYTRYSKHGLPFVVPQFGEDPFVVVPHRNISELVNLPADQLDHARAQKEVISADYTLKLKDGEAIFLSLVRRQLTRKLPLLTASVSEELAMAMSKQWQASADSWKAVKAFPSINAIISRAANRVFGGERLCRIPEFLESSREYTVAVFITGALLKLVPGMLKPLMAPILLRLLKCEHHFQVCKRVALPVIRERIAAVKGGLNDGPGKGAVDTLQWLVEDCVELAKADPSQLDEDRMVALLLSLNMVAIHSTGIAMTNVVLDLYSSPRKAEYLQGLREEVSRVLAQSHGELTKDAINSMHRIDSAIRESLRINPTSDGELRRYVIAKDGVKLSGGIYLPYLTKIIVPAHAIQHDRDLWDAPEQYDAFRFSRQGEAAVTTPQHPQGVLGQRNEALVALKSEFLPFGLGKHACPGRFFASQEMKLMLAQIVMHYDIQIDGALPKQQYIAGFNVPSSEAEIQIRLRREHTVVHGGALAPLGTDVEIAPGARIAAQKRSGCRMR